MSRSLSDESYTTFGTSSNRKSSRPWKSEMEKKPNGCFDFLMLWCFDEESLRGHSRPDDYSIATDFDDISEESSYVANYSTSHRGGKSRRSRAERDRREFLAFQQWKRMQKKLQKAEMYGSSGAVNDYDGFSTTAVDNSSLVSRLSTESARQTPPRHLFVPNTHYRDYTPHERREEEFSSHQGKLLGSGRQGADDWPERGNIEAAYYRGTPIPKGHRNYDHYPSRDQSPGRQPGKKKKLVRFASPTIIPEMRGRRPTPFPRNPKGMAPTKVNSTGSVVSDKSEIIRNTSKKTAMTSKLSHVNEDQVIENIPSDLEDFAMLPVTSESSNFSHSEQDGSLSRGSHQFRSLRATKRFATPVFERSASFDGVVQNDVETKIMEQGTNRGGWHHGNSQPDDTVASELSSDPNDHWSHVGGGAVFHSTPAGSRESDRRSRPPHSGHRPERKDASTVASEGGKVRRGTLTADIPNSVC